MEEKTAKEKGAGIKDSSPNPRKKHLLKLDVLSMGYFCEMCLKYFSFRKFCIKTAIVLSFRILDNVKFTLLNLLEPEIIPNPVSILYNQSF